MIVRQHFPGGLKVRRLDDGSYAPVSTGALVTIEESQLGPKRWAVIILRSGEKLPRTLWDRYATQAEAEAGAEAASAYLADPTSHTAPDAD